MIIARSLLVAALALCGAGTALAQLPAAASDQLRRQLGPGDTISIVQTDGKAIRGRLLRFGETDLEIRAAIPELHGPRRLTVTIPHDMIRSVERPRDSVRNGTLIGAGTGAGIAAGMFAYATVVDRNEMDEWAPLYAKMGAVVTGLGALAGWAIDNARSKPPIRVIASPARQVTVSALRVRSRGARVALAISF